MLHDPEREMLDPDERADDVVDEADPVTPPPAVEPASGPPVLPPSSPPTPGVGGLRN